MFADLVEQQTTTVGTGAYTVSGSVAGRRTFAAAFTAATKTIPYVVTDDVGGFEVGIGDWSGTSLSRVVIVASSNAGAAVNWAAGTRRIYVTPHSGVGSTGVRHNFDPATTTAPAVTNNASQGYGIGSRWLQLDTAFGNGRRYECVGFSGTDAVWVEPVQATTRSLNVLRPLGRVVLGQRANNPDSGVVARTAVNGLAVRGGEEVVGAVTSYSESASGVSVWAHTTDATPKTLCGDAGAYDGTRGIPIPPGGSALLDILLVAATASNTNRAMWRLTAAVKDGSPVTVDYISGTTALFASAGASAWSVTVGVTGDYGGMLYVRVTGAAATDIMWSATVTAAAVVRGT